MKKIVFCLLAAIAENGVFADHAWYSENVASILASLSKTGVNNYPVNATLWGSFAGGVWTPPSAKYFYTTGEFDVNNANKIDVKSYVELNNYGRYDPAKSLAVFMTSCGETVLDEFDQPYVVFNATMSRFYKEYELLNYDQAISAFDSLENYFREVKQFYENRTVTISGQAEELSKLAKEVDERLEGAKEEVENAVKQTQAVSEKLNKTLAETMAELNKIQDDAVLEAQTKINKSVSDFNSFVNRLEVAIETEGWDGTAFESAYSELEKSEQDLVDAIKELQKSPESNEAKDAILTLRAQLANIRNLKTSLRTAIDMEDKTAAKNAARGVLEQARRTYFEDSRKDTQKVVNKSKELKSKSKVLEILVDTSLSAIGEQKKLVEKLRKLRGAFSSMFVITMDNFHRINSYLGSTNSMAYIIKRTDIRSEAPMLSEFTEEELIRWIRVSAPDRIDDSYGFGASQYGGKQWNFAFDTFASTYSMWAWPLVDDTRTGHVGEKISGFWKFMQHYNLSGLSPNYNGFYEEVNESTGVATTNWLAKNITAPKNWADGETLIVTNGKYKVVNNGLPWTWTGTNFVNKVIQIGYDMKIGSSIAEDASATGDGAYYVECLFADKSCTLKRAASRAAIPTSDTTAARMHVGTVSNGEQTDRLFSSPVVYMWWY